MQHRRDVVLNTPALILVAGNADRKPRSLDRDVTTIGRARGTDLCLEANEISTLHCIIYRTAEGYRIRDCNSRSGTRVNGDSIKNGRLHNGDIVNVGLFSFEFRLPTALFPSDGLKVDPIQVEHWKRSRRKLAQRALKLRKRLIQGSASVSEQDWLHKAQLLKDKIRSYDQRFRELEEAEKELTEEREQLERQAEAQRQHVQAMEGRLAAQLSKADEEIHERWQQFQQRCQAEELRANRRATDIREPGEVEDRETEQLRQHLRDIEVQLTRQQEQLLGEQEEFTTMKEQWVKAQSKSSGALEDQQAALAQQEASVRAQKAELTRMMGELKKMQEDLRKQAKADVRSLQDDLERVKSENAELRAGLDEIAQSGAAPDHAEVESQFELLRDQIQLLRDELDAKEAILRDLQDTPHAGGDPAEAAKLRSENELLKKLLEEKNQFIAGQSIQAPAAPKTEGDLERYETELNEFRRQLEGDRNKLNREVEILRERNKELDEAIREMEMEMSKERAELARERMRLERVREEVKTDMEKMQREAAVRDSMAPLQKLRDELNGKQPPAKGEKPLNDRLRGIRNQLTDSGSAAS
jgi:pSer/pThr/pTyr-binding forkhead associated (FHA) protein